MGGKQFSYSEGDAKWYDTFMARVEKQSKGYIGLSLTNFTTSTVCTITEGTVLEINGAVFIFSADTSISGAIGTGLNYIVCSVTGTTAEAYWTSTVCAYDDAKQGFYTGSERCIGGIDSVAGSTYDDKWIYDKGRGLNVPTETRYYSVCLVGTPYAIEPGGSYGTHASFGADDQMFFEVNLPDGAIVTELYSYLFNRVGGELTINLNRCLLTSSSIDTMATTVHGGTGAQTDTTISNATIDNSTYKYYIRALADGSGSALSLGGVRIKYTITKPLP